MAGHSKFKNIQFRKGAQDKKRSKIFSKLSRDITLAAKQGLPDPTANARLRLAIASARAESMPKDNIDRAIKKAMGGETDNFEDIRYEGFGPGGVGIIVEVLTDNRNRAAASVRTIFESDADGHLITTAFEDLSAVAEALEATLGAPKSTGVVWRPKTEVPVTSAEASTIMKLIDALDDDDDVQNVYLNAEFSDEDLARHAG
jgi:transcriptional/translational regulatory protein YebC/TACO1